jgi:hypothetical protein
MKPSFYLTVAALKELLKHWPEERSDGSPNYVYFRTHEEDELAFRADAINAPEGADLLIS